MSLSSLRVVLQPGIITNTFQREYISKEALISEEPLSSELVTKKTQMARE